MKKNKLYLLGKVFIWLMLAVMYLPIVILVIFSFSGSSGIGAWGNFDFTFDLYAGLFTNEQIMSAVANTFIIAGVSCLFATFIGTISAVGIYYLHRPFKNAMSAVNRITVINADIVTAVAFMVFFIVCLNYLDGYVALIIAHTMICTPYVILSVMPRLGQINPNLYEAGRDLGAGAFRTLFTIILPQLIPGIISGAVMAFTLSLDDFVITLFNKGSGLETISTLIYSSTKHGIDPTFRALSTIIFVGILAVLIGINIYSASRRKKAKLAGGNV
ncbi:MAG: ABC transporter permease [Clostridia bacterium]|nr:ABC transporter permease [Clostridia bacterium]